MPRLIAVWRASRQGAGRGGRGGQWHRGPGEEGPADRLTPQELREVASGVRTLSLGLTRERKLAGARYMDDPKLLGAYLLFYWPVSYAQGREALGELPERPREVLDLGSGPGPLAFAAMDAGASNVTAADRSKQALALARELAAEAGEALATREWDPVGGKPAPEGKYDVITMGHVLNELYGTGPGAVQKRAALVESLLERLKPGGTLLILEPALRDTSRALLELRDAVVGHGYAVRFPCLYRGNCPALLKASDWCHAERPWSPPRVVEDIARAASIHKEELKMSYLALAPKAEAWREPPTGQVYRIVSESLEGKGRQRYMGCGPEGRVGLALQEKHRTQANEAFFHLHRGDVVRVTETEERGDGLALNERSEVRVVAAAGRGVPPAS
ncbi:MAG: small ribosomal subunit Rsm22 family protein [Myxococcaceae bacterium]|nr:small ribosomal subunit Rsm22 family protein [Myxococcaceae bacterium]MCI0670267.1 small ribosomal subunit Rsm22 family protein [Myxococcaceae bacterium]